MYIYIYIDFYSLHYHIVKQFVVLTTFKSLLILDHILGPRNDMFSCPKAVFRKAVYPIPSVT